MAEILEIQLVCSPWQYLHNFLHLGHCRWSAVRRQTHDLVLVAIVRKTQILTKGLIKYSKRMRKKYPAPNADVFPVPHSPSCAGKVSETVYRDDNGILKRRDV